MNDFPWRPTLDMMRSMRNAARAMYPLSSSKPRKKVRIRICGRKTTTPPTPARIPSVSKDRRSDSGSTLDIASARAFCPASMRSMGHWAMEKMQKNMAAMATKKTGHPQRRWVRMESKRSDRVGWVLRVPETKAASAVWIQSYLALATAALTSMSVEARAFCSATTRALSSGAVWSWSLRRFGVAERRRRACERAIPEGRLSRGAVLAAAFSNAAGSGTLREGRGRTARERVCRRGMMPLLRLATVVTTGTPRSCSSFSRSTRIPARSAASIMFRTTTQGMPSSRTWLRR